MYCLFRLTTRWQQKKRRIVARELKMAVAGMPIPSPSARFWEQSVQCGGRVGDLGEGEIEVEGEEEKYLEEEEGDKLEEEEGV